MYSIQGAIVAASCLCFCLPGDNTQMAAIPMFLGGFMVTNTGYHFLRLKYKEFMKR